MFPLSQNRLAVAVVAWIIADWFVCFRLMGGEHAGTAFTILLFLGGAGAGWLFVSHDGPIDPDPDDGGPV